MNISTQILLNIVTSTGVSALVVFVLRTYISEKIKAGIKNEYDKKLEDFKSKIKQIEYLRENRYNALKNLNSIYLKIYPKKYHLDMEWEDALGIIANHFSEHEKLLKDFLIEYSHVLDKEITKLIEDAVFQCSNGQLEDERNQLEYADKLFKNVVDAKENLSNKLNQESI